jgi:HD-GYP domain-containing protein (c-di-GMP phosphodiesterase class II)
MQIAREMNVDEEFLETLRISAQLHDVGKIGIEDHILKKPGALTPEEFEIMKTHTTKGANLLRPVKQLKEMLPGIELHHESLDGRGYPYGLKGDQIPPLARVIAVADTFDALTTNRPYQRAFDPQEALKIIHSLAGKRLDPDAVAALTSVFERGEIRVMRRRTVTPTNPAAGVAENPAPAPVAPESEKAAPVSEPPAETAAPTLANAASASASEATGPAAVSPSGALPDPAVQTTRF